jgi:hypothetical protein
VLRPTRPLPRVGSHARILHFGGAYEAAVVTAVHDEGRRLVVDAEGGETFEFLLNAATARFIAAGSAQGARLELLGDPAQGA